MKSQLEGFYKVEVSIWLLKWTKIGNPDLFSTSDRNILQDIDTRLNYEIFSALAMHAKVGKR